MTTITPARAGQTRRYPRFLGVGAGSGLLGSICCVGSAIAAAPAYGRAAPTKADAYQ